MKINCKTTDVGAKLPTRSHETDAGSDLYLPGDHNNITVLGDGQIKMINTHLCVEIPEGYFGLVTGRSSLNKRGLLCFPGIIDSHYRGEIRVLLQNHSEEDQTLEGGERIAQLLILPCASPSFELVSELSETARGAGGFGSTGK